MIKLKPKTDEFFNELPKPSRKERAKRFGKNAAAAGLVGMLAIGTYKATSGEGMPSPTDKGSGVHDPEGIMGSGENGSVATVDLHEDPTKSTVLIVPEDGNIYNTVDDYMDGKHDTDVDVSGMVRDIVDERGSSHVEPGDEIVVHEPTDGDS